MSTCKKIILLSTVLLSIQFVTAQIVLQKKMDSLEVVLFSLNKKDTLQIVKLGDHILEKTSSEKQRFRVFQKLSESYFLTNKELR